MDLTKLDNLIDFTHGNGATFDEIINAESKLMIKFSDEFKVYTKRYSSIVFNGHEIQGVTDNIYFDVIKNTLRNKEVLSKIPDDFYLIEDTGYEGICIWQNQKGEIFMSFIDSSYRKITNSLLEYLQTL